MVTECIFLNLPPQPTADRVKAWLLKVTPRCWKKCSRIIAWSFCAVCPSVICVVFSTPWALGVSIPCFSKKHICSPLFLSFFFFFFFANRVFRLFSTLQVFFWVFLFIPIGLSELGFTITEFSFAWNMSFGLDPSKNSFSGFRLLSIFVYLEDPEKNWILSVSDSLFVKPLGKNLFNSVYS